MMKKIPLGISMLSILVFSALSFATQPALLSTTTAIAQVKKTVEQEKLVGLLECVDYVYSGKASAQWYLNTFYF